MNATEPSLIRVETIADLPVLWAILQRIDLRAILDRLYPTPLHWTGDLTPADVLSLWILFIVSQGDHRLNQLEPWVEQHQLTLSALTGKNVLPRHAHDDRLADLLDRLADHDRFAQLELELNQQTIRVYQLPTDTVRIDTTTANSHSKVLSEQGLLQFGFSKDDPNRPQLKIAAAVLDPLGMPLATSVVPGNSTDDPLYIPTIRAVRQSLGTGKRTYIGDCKMGALDTRAFVAAGGDFYLCPLAETQFPRSGRLALLQSVWDGTQALQSVYRGVDEGVPREKLAEGFSVDVELTAQVDGKAVCWTERRWLTRSLAYAAAQESALERRLKKVVSALCDLPTRRQGKKVLSGLELEKAIQTLQVKGGVEGLLDVRIVEEKETCRRRGYGTVAAREEVKIRYTVEVVRNEEVIAQKKREMGWQVYATNHLGLLLSQTVSAYRGQYRIEDGWSRLKGRPLSLTPMYLQDEERMRGLVYLLSVALRILTLVEWGVRERLRVSQEKLDEIYAGQRGRKTSRPSAELLLRAMKTIRISVVEVDGRVYVLLSPMTAVQKRLLDLWGLPVDLYEQLVRSLSKPPPNTSEP